MLVEDSLDEILCTSYHNAQSGVCAVWYKVVKQNNVGDIAYHIIGGTLVAYKVKFFNSDAAAHLLLEKSLT